MGDSEADIAAGKQLGIPVVCVDSGIRARPFLEALKPNLIIDILGQLPAVIEKSGTIGLLRATHPSAALTEG